MLFNRSLTFDQSCFWLWIFLDFSLAGDIDENWHLSPIANDEALPLPGDPNVVAKLELLDSKYYQVNGDHLEIKRDRHIPISIKSSRMYQSYLVGLVHTASGMDNKPIVSKNGGPAFDTNIGIKKILSTASHGNIHVMQVLKKDFSLKFDTEGSHRANEGNRKDNRIWSLFVLPMMSEDANDVLRTNEDDFKESLKQAKTIQVVAELRTLDKIEATMNWLKRRYEFSPEDEENQRNILKKCSKNSL